MKINIGSLDRIIRAVAGGAIAILFLTGVISGIWGVVLLVIGGILVLTSLFKLCPIYLALGIDTSPSNKRMSQSNQANPGKIKRHSHSKTGIDNKEA